MNDQGLFFDWVADNPSDDWTRNSHKLNYVGSVSELVLEDVASVEEALRFYERYNETAFLKSRTMLVDKSGACAIVGWNNGKLKIIRGREGFQAMGFGHGTAMEGLKRMEKLSVESASSILMTCLQSREYPTQYSNVYDLRHGDVYVYLFHQHKPFIKLNLQEELSKGHHFYNIPLIAEQIKQSPMTDGKTQYAAEIDPAVYLAYVGKYLIQPDYVFTITTENGRLYYHAHDASHPEIFSATRTKFLLRSLDANLIFVPGDNGKAMRPSFMYVARILSPNGFNRCRQEWQGILLGPI